jgi:hypothetical protein
MKSKKYPESKPAAVEQSKVAEPVASYTTASASALKPITRSRRIAGLEASDEVWNFAQKHQLVPHLEKAVRLAKETLDNPQAVYLTYEPDPEIPSLHGIGINARISSDNLDDWERQYRAFQQRFLREIPKEVQPQICLLLWGA